MITTGGNIVSQVGLYPNPKEMHNRFHKAAISVGPHTNTKDNTSLKGN